MNKSKIMCDLELLDSRIEKKKLCLRTLRTEWDFGKILVLILQSVIRGMNPRLCPMANCGHP